MGSSFKAVWREKKLSAVCSAVVAGLAVTSAATAADGSWAVDANGVWSDTANWADAIVADGVGSTALLANDISATRTVSLDGARTIGGGSFSDSGSAGSAWLVNGGNVLTLSVSSGSPTFSVNTTATFSGVTLGGSQGFTKTGTGQLNIGGNHTMTGGIVVAGGTLRVTGGGSAAVFASSNTVTLRNGSTFHYDNLGGSNNKNVSYGQLIVSSGDNRVISQRAPSLSVGITFASLARTAGATLTFESRDQNGNTSGPASGATIALNSGASSGILSQGVFITDTVGTDYSIFNAGPAGQTRVPVYGTTTGTANAGAALAGSTATTNQVTASITGQVATQIRMIKFAGASAVNLGLADNATLTLTSAGLLRVGGSSTAITGNNVSLRAGTVNAEYVVNTVSANDSLSIGAGVLANGTNVFTKAGAGTVTLGKINTYTGNTFVNNGTLALADDAQLKFVIGATGVNNKILGSGTLNLDGDFNFDLTGAATELGSTWDIVSVSTLNETFGSNFTVAGFTNEGGIWKSGNYEFNPGTGQLSVVPEPGSMMLLAAAAPLFWRRRRAAGRTSGGC